MFTKDTKWNQFLLSFHHSDKLLFGLWKISRELKEIREKIKPNTMVPLYGQSREQRPLLKKMDQLRYYDLKVLKGSRIYEDSR